MEKIFLTLFIAVNSLFSFWNFLAVNAENEETYFIVTAYYSPLPNQDFYLKWDYEKEVFLNGQWIKWASGKAVFPWMLAAPKNYSFGTKIYLDWIWVWVVEDRGGAIVQAGERNYEYDRIDVWMWYWQEGLIKALNWGKRKVKGYVVDSSLKTTISLTGGNKIETKKAQVKIISIYEKSIGLDSSKEDIKELQTLLQWSWFYKWKIDGIYNNEVVNIILNFQKENNIIKDTSEIWAWYWGAKTRSLFAKKYKDKKNAPQEIIRKDVENDEVSLFNTYIAPESEKEKIVLLQNFFKEIGQYKGEATGKYSDIKETLIRYQIERKIVAEKNEVWVGYFWPKTRKIAKEEYDKFTLEKKKNQELAEKKEKVILAKTKEAKELVNNLWDVKFWETSSQVRDFQKTLKLLWYFQYDDTATFGDITKKSLVSYQISKGIIKNEKEDSAWIFWPKTKENFIKDLASYFTEKDLNNKELAMK